MSRGFFAKILAGTAALIWAEVVFLAAQFWVSLSDIRMSALALTALWPFVPALIAGWVTRMDSARKSSLVYLIDQEERRLCKPSRWKRIGDIVERVYEPSWTSFAVVAIPIALLGLLAHSCKTIFSFELLTIDAAHYQNLIAIHAGIGAIIIALVIFVAESLRDDETKDRARVLLRESMMFPLAIAEVLVFAIFLWGTINVFSIIAIIGVAIMAIASLWRLIKVLLSRSRFAERRMRLLTERLGRSIRLAIRERIGNNILLGSLHEQKIELEYYPFTPEDYPEKYHCFEFAKEGSIVDIRIDKLREFARLAEKCANANGRSFYGEKTMLLREAQESTLSGQSASDKKYVVAKFYLLKKFASRIDSESKPALCIEKAAVTSAADQRRLARLAKEAFKVRLVEDFSEEVMSEFSTITDQFVSAVRMNQPEKVNELTKTFIKVAETFLDMINACGGGFSYEQAKKEHGSWPTDTWSSISWLRENVWEVLQATNDVRQQHVALSVVYLPYVIAKRAVDREDHYVFQTFINFAVMVYVQSFDIADQRISKLVRERSYTHIKETIDYFIEPKLRDAKSASELENFGNFSKHLLFVISNLLKSAFDKKDLESFSAVADICDEAFRHFTRDSVHARPEFLKQELETKTDDTERSRLQEKIAFAEMEASVTKDLDSKKQQVFFGMTTWILDRMRISSTSEGLAEFYAVAAGKLENNIFDFTEVFVETKDRDEGRFWQWDSWELIPNGGVQTIDLSNKLDRFYLTRMLALLSAMDDAAIAGIQLPPSRTLAFMAEDNSSQMKFLDEVEKTSGKVMPVLNASAVAKVSQLKELLKATKQRQEESESKFLAEAKIVPKKRSEFVKNLLSSFEKSTEFRAVFSLFGMLRDSSQTKTLHKDVKMWGFNQIDRKEAFVEDWYVSYGEWGSQFGDGMARSEDRMVYREMADAIGTSIQLSDSASLVETIVSQLKTMKLKRPVVIQPGNFRIVYEGLRPSSNFVDRYRPDHGVLGYESTDSYVGYIRNGRSKVPVFRVSPQNESLRGTVCVISAHDFARLHVYPPIEKEQDKQKQVGTLSLEIIDLNEDEKARKTLMDQNPAWLKEHTDPVNYLRKRVVIKVFEKFEFKILDKNAGFKLVVGKPSASGEDDEE